MKQILQLSSDDNLSQIVKLNLIKSYEVSIIEKKSVIEGIEILKIIPNIDLIIVFEENDATIIAQTISQFLIEADKEIPLMILGNKFFRYTHTKVISPKTNWDDLVKEIALITKLELLNDTENKTFEEFVPVQINYFLNINSTSMGCDVYLRIKRSNEEFQFIKRLHSHDTFTRDDIEKYVKSGLKEFYVKKEHFKNFVNFVTNQMILKMENKNQNSSELLQTYSEAYDLTIDRINSIGIDKHTIGLVEESIKSIQLSIADNHALVNFINGLKLNKLSFPYAHAYLISLILSKITDFFEWGTPSVKDKFIFMAFFHDISLTDPKLIAIHSQNQLTSLNLTKKENTEVLNHAYNSVKILENFPGIPAGVSTYIKEHHGAKNGIGFPEGINLQLSPISIAFIVVESFVQDFLKINGTPNINDLKNIFLNLRLIYNKGTYLQTVEALELMTSAKK